MTVVVVERYHVPKNQLYPGSGARQHGNVHLHVVEDAQLGRRKRRRGECLCSKKHGSYERALEGTEAERLGRCPSCAKVASEHGIEWPSEIGVEAQIRLLRGMTTYEQGKV